MQELRDLNANPIDVSHHLNAMTIVAHPTYSIQGISYEPVEDNLLDWKCSIKGGVRYSAYAPRMVTMDSEPRAVGQPVQGGHVLL